MSVTTDIMQGRAQHSKAKSMAGVRKTHEKIPGNVRKCPSRVGMGGDGCRGALESIIRVYAAHADGRQQRRASVIMDHIMSQPG